MAKKRQHALYDSASGSIPDRTPTQPVHSVPHYAPAFRGGFALAQDQDRVFLIPGARTEYYSPFESYYSGDRPHHKFAALAVHSTPEDVLAFVNQWGPPKPGMFLLAEIRAQAERMYSLAELLSLIRDQTRKRRRQLREFVADLARTDEVLVGLLISQEDMDKVWPTWAKPEWGMMDYEMNDEEKALYEKATQMLREWPTSAIKIIRDPARVSDDRILEAAQKHAASMLNAAIERTRPVVYHQDRKTVAAYLAYDLLDALYLMFYLDIARDSRIRKCPRPNCSRIFEAGRKNQTYCSIHCARAEAMRLYRQRLKSKTKKGGKHHGRVQKRR